MLCPNPQNPANNVSLPTYENSQLTCSTCRGKKPSCGCIVNTAMASAQQKDAEVQAYHQSSKTHFSLKTSPVETKVPHFQLKDIACGDQGATPLCPVAGSGKCSTWSTVSHTHPSVPPGLLSLPSSFGLIYKNK